jgi:hypothetical protein
VLQLTLNERGELSLRAQAVPLSGVLAELRKHQVDVVIPDFRDVVLNIAFDNVPLVTALERIIPEGTHPVVRLGEREFVGSGKSGDKPGRVNPRNSTLPRKDTVAVIPLDRDRPAKRDVDKVPPQRSERGPTFKPVTTDTIIRGGTGPKRSVPALQDTTRHIWLSFRIDTLRNVQLTGIRVLEGPRVVSTIAQGTYFYLITANGQPVAIESFYDPFELHAYTPRTTDPHRTVRAATANLTATMPLGDRTGLLESDIVIQVYRLRPGESMPRMDLEGAALLVRRGELVAASAPGALRGPIREALQTGR